MPLTPGPCGRFSSGAPCPGNTSKPASPSVVTNGQSSVDIVVTGTSAGGSEFVRSRPGYRRPG